MVLIFINCEAFTGGPDVGNAVETVIALDACACVANCVDMDSNADMVSNIKSTNVVKSTFHCFVVIPTSRFEEIIIFSSLL